MFQLELMFGNLRYVFSLCWNILLFYLQILALELFSRILWTSVWYEYCALYGFDGCKHYVYSCYLKHSLSLFLRNDCSRSVFLFTLGWNAECFLCNIQRPKDVLTIHSSGVGLVNKKLSEQTLFWKDRCNSFCH